MKEEVVFAGFGGQGILFVGQVLAHAAMLEGYHVSWLPSYGPEMRGGTANCTVVISDQRIRSPLVDNPRAVLAFNQPSLDRYEPRLVPGGLLVYNSSMTERTAPRADVQAAGVPADALAETLDLRKSMNMVMLGRYIEMARTVSPERIRAALEQVFPDARSELRAVNWKAFELGLGHLPVG